MFIRVIILVLLALNVACPVAWGVEGSSLRAFLEATEGRLIRRNLTLFCYKMRQAEKSEFLFFRAFPELFYNDLRAEDADGALRATPVLMLIGDTHTDNMEIFHRGGRRIPQFNDFDDSGLGPVALDLARMMTCACVLSATSSRTCAKVASEARKAYLASLDMDFQQWIERVQSESAVREAETRRIDWASRAEEPKSRDRSERLAREVGLDTKLWRAYARDKGGLSSIGLPRVLFLSPWSESAYELKELDPSALSYFTGKSEPRSHVERVGEAYFRFRQVPAEARALSLESRAWVYRHRVPEKTELDVTHETSSARVMAGLLAQQHREQAPIERLQVAMKAVTPRILSVSVAKLRKQRTELRKLLDEGAWGCNRFR